MGSIHGTFQSFEQQTLGPVLSDFWWYQFASILHGRIRHTYCGKNDEVSSQGVSLEKKKIPKSNSQLVKVCYGLSSSVNQLLLTSCVHERILTCLKLDTTIPSKLSFLVLCKTTRQEMVNWLNRMNVFLKPRILWDKNVKTLAKRERGISTQ